MEPRTYDNLVDDLQRGIRQLTQYAEARKERGEYDAQKQAELQVQRLQAALTAALNSNRGTAQLELREKG